MRILITGKNGQLGIDLNYLLKRKENVVTVGRNDFDITDLKSTKKCITEYMPDIVVHCAAYTKVDDSEKHIDLAFKVNAIGTGNIASLCNDIGATMVYISTDYVFDGKNTSPYNEFDIPNPINIYGKSKLAGENVVKEICDKHYIVRTSWLYGKNGNNFVKTMLRLSKTKDEIKVVSDQCGTPTYTKDLAECIYFLIKTGAYGTYHITNSGITTWYEFAKKLFELSGIKTQVLPISSEEYNSPANRPKYSVLDNFVLRHRFDYELRNWEDAIKEFLIEIEQK